MNKVNIKDSQNFITSKYHIEKIMNCISLDEKVSFQNWRID